MRDRDGGGDRDLGGRIGGGGTGRSLGPKRLRSSSAPDRECWKMNDGAVRRVQNTGEYLRTMSRVRIHNLCPLISGLDASLPSGCKGSGRMFRHPRRTRPCVSNRRNRRWKQNISHSKIRLTLGRFCRTRTPDGIQGRTTRVRRISGRVRRDVEVNVLKKKSKRVLVSG